MTSEKNFTNSNSNRSIKTSCAKCNNKTNHEIISSSETNGTEIIDIEEENTSYSIEWRDEYQVIRCKGCDNVSFRHESWYSEDDPSEPINEKIYPKIQTRGVSYTEAKHLPVNLRMVFPRKNGHEILCGFRQLFKLYRRHEANA